MNIGFIGLGIMGESMSANILQKSGCPVTVYDIDKKAVAKLQEQGAIAANSIKEIAATCNIIISMVPKSEHVQSVYSELLPELKDGQITIDMSTIDPQVSIGLAKKVAATGAVMLDAPVVKSKPAAIKGELGIYVGGSTDALAKVQPILACMGSNIIHMGANGSGLYMKIVHNALVAQIQNGVNEMLLFGQKCGLDIDSMVKAISYGGGQNFYLDGKAQAIKEENFTTMFSVANMDKDIRIANDIARDQKLKLPGLARVQEVYQLAMQENLGAEDFSATYKVIRQTSC